VTDYKSLTGPAVAALLEAARPLGAEVSVNVAKLALHTSHWHPCNVALFERQICGVFAQILKASEIVEKAFLVSQQHVLARCIWRSTVDVLCMSQCI